MKTNPSPGGSSRSLDPQHWVIERDEFGHLLEILRGHGYTIVGPTIRDGAMLYDEISGPGELPVGWTDVQEAGQYRLEKRDDGAWFGYVVGPQSWKKYLFPPRLRLWRARRRESGFAVEGDADELMDVLDRRVREAAHHVDDLRRELPEEPPAPTKHPRLALIGVRACELAAMAIQDTVLMGGKFQDPHYRERRESVFVLAVNCTQAGATCFCVSMNTGPRARDGYDILVTEVIENGRHFFVAVAGTDRGMAVLRETEHRRATEQELAASYAREARAVTQMGRKLDTQGLKDVLLAAQSHPRWDSIAERCLACANCTLVCPTCFCSTVEDTVDLTGETAERWRRWDSCFNQDFSYIHGGSVRASTAARYRQWMTHKLATWYEQFGSSGCVGCGRCITWCPVGIDITAEANALRDAVTKRGK